MNTALSTVVEIEPELRAQAESVLDKIGLSFSQAVNLFTRQIVIRKSFPVELKLEEPVKKTLCIEGMTEEELDAVIQEGIDDAEAGRTSPFSEFKEEMEKSWH